MAGQRSDPNTNRKKVKTGCRTCKARRVKCDEGRPSCHRCSSTGRVCDGYGVWGGGAAAKQGARAISPRTLSESVRHAVSSHYGKLSAEQETCFRWFRYRTYTKLPLPFITPFWHTLVLQACAAEPAILHAALALGSAHQRESLEEGAARQSWVALDAQQGFMLREYGKAIRSLQPHFSSRDGRSIQVALVVCALFTFFENLLGRYTTANAHLHSGLRLIAECYTCVGYSDDGTITVTAKKRGYVDDWIIESFTRLHVQAALLGQGLPDLYSRLPMFPIAPIPIIFQSANHAAHHMDRLMLDILQLADQGSLLDNSGVDPAIPVALHERQQALQRELDLWIEAYNATEPDRCAGFSPVDGFYMKVLRGYHTMATIIINTCLEPARETMYDSCTADFIFLVEQLVAIWKAHVARPVWHLNPWTTEMPRRISHSVGDKGWIPLLYFIAVKCRVHRIRLQAVRLLSQTVHKEGVWDSKLVLIIAKEIIRTEEGDFYKDFNDDDKFNVVSIPTIHDITLPPLPDYCRLYNVRVGLPEHPLGVLTLEYGYRREDGSSIGRRRRYYDLKVSRWVSTISESPVW
ncbi:putative Zn2 Cys6 DNA-binding protein [Rosellinia necatrix]|uniref:Putative Zn2 Cys6 DNA-binding protein n=1 Tax=Rosellinia necatrix TaxID=77044 RepID=A0A1S7UMM9_ROSNE|nr:putative Zn2 Cys6 DNA-binding protein [Rosellinia necatrix]